MQHSSLCCSQPALCGMHALPALCTNWSSSRPVPCSTPALCHLHVVPVWPSRLVTLSSSSPLLLAYRGRPYLLCAACMCYLFVPPDWSVCHPVASSTCQQVQALLALCHLHVVPVWPSRLVSLSSSSLFYLPTGAGPTCSVPPACGACLALQTGLSVIQ